MEKKYRLLLAPAAKRDLKKLPHHVQNQVAFDDAIIRLAENPEDCEKLGIAARGFAVKELDRKKILSQFTGAPKFISKE